MPDQNLQKKVAHLASQCVKCGLCLPYCPTYGISKDENESPRGRIEILQALAKGQLEPTKKNVGHLDRCLSCRHCERVCPAHVKYESLITTGKTWLQTCKPSLKKLAPLSWHTRFLTSIVTHPSKLMLMGKFLRFLQVSGLRLIGKYTGITFLLGLSSLNKLLPKVPSQKAFAKIYMAHGKQTNRVGLFLGCLSRWCDRMTPMATIYVLNQCGVTICVPRDQGCCGAIAFHQGDEKKSHDLFEHNAKIFTDCEIDTIITTASGCGAMLCEAHDDSHQRALMKPKIADVSHYILPKLRDLKLKSLKYKVALHTPCTLQNGMKQSDSALNMLQHIPDLQIFPITEKETCCGSAGTYMLEHPQWANELVQKIVNQIHETQLDFVATSNIGCALHIQKAINDRGLKIKVIHPIVLLAQSLGWQV